MKSLAAVVVLSLATIPITGEGAERPNVLVIMVDDLGYSDLGCYGGEIETPVLDALATGGTRFSQFYNTAKCHSSRVSLLTGQYCLAAGNTALSHAVTSAEVLGEGGYFTAMTGKWHLNQQPTDFGFDRYFGHLSGACNYFSGDKTFRLNGKPWTVPATDFYTTVADVDFALRFLDEARRTDAPWYLYVAFNAPHAPLHALPEDYARYERRYDAGWDEIRAARVAKQKRIGLLPKDLKPSPRPDHVPTWESLPEWRREYESNRMQTLAAMIDRVDREVGRLVSDLKANDDFENTLILFVSDNGACPYDRRPPRLDVEPTNAETFLGDSTGWAWARNTPFRFYKQNQFEGGISTPAIVHWPAGSKGCGRVVDEPGHLIDVLPTLADVTGCAIPGDWPERELRPVSGVSLRPILEGDRLERPQPIHFLFSQDRGLRDGDWKLVSFRGAEWELYNVAEDRTELVDLAAEEPKRLQAMVDRWSEMARDVLDAPRIADAEMEPKQLPYRHPEWTNFEKREPPAPRIRVRRAIRARKNTAMTIANGTIGLRFTGEDPGIAMDVRNRNLAKGPYALSFELSTREAGTGDVYFTTEAGETLPRGKHVEFEVAGTDGWQKVRVPLKTTKSLQLLRVDTADGPGEARIRRMQLTDDEGEVLAAWPE